MRAEGRRERRPRQKFRYLLPHQRQALFDRPQARQSKVLVRPALREPTIICQIDKHVGARAGACAIGKNSFIATADAGATV